MKLSITAKWIYGITQVLIFVMIMAGAAIITVAGWLMLEPREIPELTSAIQKSLNKEKSPYYLTVEKTILALGDLSHPLEVIIRDVSLQSAQKKEVVRIPTLQISLDLWSLFMGEVQLEKVTLLEPSLAIFQDEDGVFYLSAKEDKKAIALRDLFSSTSTQDKDSALFAKKMVELDLVSGNLSFSSALNHLGINIPTVDVSLRQSQGIFRGRADLKALQKGQKDAQLDVYFTYDPTLLDALVRLDFKALKLANYADVITQLNSFKEVDLPVTGMAELELKLPKTIKRFEVDVRDAGVGSFRYEPYFNHKMTVTQLAIKGNYDADKKQARLDHFEYASKKGAKIFVEGEWSEDAQEKMALKGRAQVTGMSKKLLINLWPVGVAMNPRTWIDSSVIDAFIPSARIVMNAPVGAFDLEALPEEVLSGTIDVQNAEVNYSEGFPHVKNGNGKVMLTGNTLTAILQNATTLNDTKLSGEGKVYISSLVATDTPITIDLPVYTSTQDVLEFLKSTPYKLPTSVNLNQETVTGNLFGDVHMFVLDKPSPAEDDVTFKIAMDAKGFGQTKFYKGMDVNKASGKVLATDKDFTVDASGLYDGQRVQLSAVMQKSGENYRVKTTMPHEKLKAFGIESEPYVYGDVGVSLDWKEIYNHGAQFNADIDLTPAEIRIADIKYLKEAGVPATLKLKGEENPSGYEIPDFTLEIPDRKDALKGAVNLSPSGEIKEVNLRGIDFAGTKGQALYRPIPGGYFVRASGEVLDLSYRDDGEEKKKNNPVKIVAEALPKPEVKIPALDVDFQFKKAVTSKDGKNILHDLKFVAQCDTVICKSMDFTTNAGAAAPFTLNIGYQNGKRVLTSYTPNAGLVLRNMNLFDSMKDGEMQISGIFQDELPTHPLVGKLTIGAHRVKDVPMLTKLLTVATFTGIVDALSGEGLMFQKLDVPFRKEGMVIRLENAKSAGPSIGLTAEGNIDLNQDSINLSGVVIPAYMFNAIIRSIPVLGNIFGVLAGDGLVAVNYSMKGDLDDPDVTVNPLSALTPGFLRGFFSIFDNEDAATRQKRQDTKNAINKLESDINNIQIKKLEAMPEKTPESSPEAGMKVDPKPVPQETPVMNPR